MASDAAGRSSWQALNESFGQTLERSGNRTRMNLRFAGQYFDEETGTHYNYQRDYSPGVGRYLQTDPIGIDGGVNVFVYAEENPVKLNDPTGQQAVLPGPGGIPIPIPGPTPGGPRPTPIDPTDPRGPTYGPNPINFPIVFPPLAGLCLGVLWICAWKVVDAESVVQLGVLLVRIQKILISTVEIIQATLIKLNARITKLENGYQNQNLPIGVRLKVIDD